MLPVEEYVEVPRKVWTREEAHTLVAMGFPNAEKLELVDGDLIDRTRRNRPHIMWQHLALWWLQSVFGLEHVQMESPTDVAPEDNPVSEPEPDLTVTSKSLREYSANPQPEDIQLVVEVADSTRNFDLNAKARLYARAQIIEYWVLNIRDKQLVVHREPVEGAYASIRTYAANDEVAPLAAPEARFRMDAL